MKMPVVHTILLVMSLLGTILLSNVAAAEAYLAPRNTEVPFPYKVGATRSWPILRAPLPAGGRISFIAKRGENTLAQGNTVGLPGMKIDLAEDRYLRIVSETDTPEASFELEVSLALPGGDIEYQTLSILAAPPARPISYLADFGDDLIRIFNGTQDGSWQPLTRDGFDQYFRRCQMQGIDRLILWLTAMPYVTDAANYTPEDWENYVAQAKALTESPNFLKLIETRKKGAAAGEWGLHLSWDWIRQLNLYRLIDNFGPMLSQSAMDHGIKLTVSFRPFEPALTKYYELPAFDQDGTYLWGFLPMASPTVNYQTSETSFAHYRTILEKMGFPEKGQIGSITLPGAATTSAWVDRFQQQGDNLRIHASDYPPLQPESLVLQRQPDGTFALVPFGGFSKEANGRRTEVTDFTLRVDGTDVHLENLHVAPETRYLILSNPSDDATASAPNLATFAPVTLHSKAGNALGRENVYWVLDDDPALSSKTRVPGIPETGNQATEFDATEAGYLHLYQQGEPRTDLKNRLLVIDLGAPYSVETLDLQQPVARANAIKELKTVLDLPAFDELFVNTRSHVQLSAYQGDGDEGIQPLVNYRQAHKSYTHLGIDRAYAPVSLSEDPVLKSWAADPELVERITTWQTGEWEGYGQEADSPFRWRYARNKAVADGVRLLLQDVEEAFPGIRTRVVIPMGAQIAQEVRNGIATLQRADGTAYGPDYNGVWTTVNHIPAIGEGMAMLDLSGLSTEPVFFGVRDMPEAEPFALYFEAAQRDLAANRGSSFRGPRSFFFEAQYSLRRSDYDVARADRERIICNVLSHAEEVSEVILYEAADWLYFLPFQDRDLNGHYFLERCAE